jgi:hypothetical protein
MSDITVINDSEQSSLVTNGLAKNGELYLKAAGSTDAGAIVAYDSGSWRTFANEASPSFQNQHSVEFDGTDDVLQTGVAYATTWSVSTWIKPNFTSGTSQACIFADGGARRAYMSYNGTTYTAYLRQSGGAFIILTSSGHAIHDTWTHIAYTRDSSTSTATMYINGSQVATVTDGGDVANKQQPSYIGCRNTSGSLPFKGKIDEFGWWDGTALSSSDVTAIYNSGVPDDLTSYSPTNWWRMGDNDSGAGTTITDQGSGSNDGTLTNGPTFSTDVPS